MRAFLFFMSYLLCAIALEIAILPQLQIVTPWVLAPLLDIQLLAMAGVLAGLLRGEMAGLGLALVAAFCFGVSERLGLLGPSIVSFALVGWMAGWLARHLRLQGSISRFITISLLLMGERFVWSLTHWLVWRDGAMNLPWSSLLASLLTAVLGAVILKVVSGFSRRMGF